MHFDEWNFDYRFGDVACAVQCFSHLMNGEVDLAFATERERRRRRGPRPTPPPQRSELADLFDYDDYRSRLVYGARVLVHRKDPSGEECPMFGHCSIEFCGYLYSARFFEQAHSDALEPLVVRPVDGIELGAVVHAMDPLWRKMRAKLDEEVEGR